MLTLGEEFKRSNIISISVIKIVFSKLTINPCVGKNLALLQAEASACGLELANVPNVRWHLLHGLS